MTLNPQYKAIDDGLQKQFPNEIVNIIFEYTNPISDVHKELKNVNRHSDDESLPDFFINSVFSFLKMITVTNGKENKVQVCYRLFEKLIGNYNNKIILFSPSLCTVYFE